MPYKYFVNTLFKLKNNFCPSFPWIPTQKESENVIKKELTTKHFMLEATNLHQLRKSYTIPGCDGWDI